MSTPFRSTNPSGAPIRRPRKRWALILAWLVALLAVGTVGGMYVYLKNTLAEADARIRAAESAELEARQATQEARTMRDTVYVKTLAYEIAQQEAVVARQQAEVAQKQAESRMRRARNDRRRAEHAFDDAAFAELEAQLAQYKLEQESSKLAALYLEQSNLHIRQLAYDNALRYTRDAVRLGVAEPEVSDALLEFAYWFAETGDLNRAWGLLDTAYALAGDSLIRSGDDRKAVRAAIRKQDSVVFTTLEKRYFPTMVTVPGGSDTLGGLYPTPLLPVQVSYFQLAETETTWWQYGLFCAAEGLPLPVKPAGVADVGDHPVCSVTWYEAVAYANWLNKRFGLNAPITGYPGRDASYRFDTTEQGFRLPTECEWEYAARAHARTLYAGSDTLEQVAWTLENSRGKTQPVKQLKPNAFGLYDMSGNVWEWCWDWGEEYPAGLQVNYMGPKKGTERVFRGGSSYFKAEYARIAARFDDAPGSKFDAFGFRVAR
jgi:formylglycine-generating enzyme required for sulfatase activity